MLARAIQSLGVPLIQQGLLGCVPRATRNIFTIVEQGQEAYRLTLGKHPEKLDAGIAWNIPLLHSVQKIDMREGPISIGQLDAYTNDNIPVTIAGTLFYQVTDSYKACFSVQSYLTSVSNIGSSALRSVIGAFQYDEIIADRNQINARLKVVVGDMAAHWGVQCTKFEIQTFKPSNRDVERQLELQMEAERNRRKQLLDTDAAVNAAEGDKKRAILVSEGVTQAEVNKTMAMRQQIEQLTAAVGGDAKLAVDYLVRARQLDHLAALASGPNNVVYLVNADILESVASKLLK